MIINLDNNKDFIHKIKVDGFATSSI